MKRHLISEEIVGKDRDNQKRCAATSLAILGNCRTLIGEDRDASESEHRDFKRPRLQQQEHQKETALSTKIEDDTYDPKLCYVNLVSSAVTFICNERNRLEKQRGNQQERDQASSSAASISSGTPSLSSEHSVYRSYEMEIPDQQHTSPRFSTSSKDRLSMPPRLPTIFDLPHTGETFANSGSGSLNCQLNSRRYGEQGGYGDSNSSINNQGNINKIGFNLPNQILVRTVIYK
jgi:hypothetical protein